MEQESVVALIRDLTSKLAEIATEFGERAEQAVTQEQTVQGDVLPAVAPRQATRRELAERLIAERRARRKFFAADLFHEPAWDMLLSLYLAGEDRRVLNVKALVAATEAPVTTSQRWIDHLHKLRLIDRVGDPDDRRRVEVSLSDAGTKAVANYLDAIATP